MQDTDTVAPHGGHLVTRVVDPKDRTRHEERARTLRRLVLNPREISDLVLLGIGAFSPLEGFITSADHRAVVEEGRLASGLPWTIPITLAVTREIAQQVALDQEAALCDRSGKLLGTMEIRDKFEYDKEREAQHVYGTTDVAHPGVAYLRTSGEVMLGGPVTLIDFPPLEPIYERYFLRPNETRYLFRKKGWRTVVAFQTRNPVHRAHEYIQRCSLETVDGLMIHPLVGETKADDVPAAVRMRCYLALLENYYPKHRVVLSVFPAAMRYAGPREAVFHALVRKNYGCTHIIIGRDHAGVGNFYGPFDAHRIFERYAAEEIGIRPMFFDFTFYCRRCGGIASEKTCGHDSSERLVFSGTKVRELLARGESLPAEFTRPEIAAILLAAYREQGDGSARRPSGAARRERVAVQG